MSEHENHPDVVWEGSDEPIAPIQPEKVEPVETIEEDDDPIDVYQPIDSVDAAQLMITSEKRKEILGRLAEFELQLAALSGRMQGFVLAYLQDPTNQAECARKAGYAPDTAKVKASQLMADSRIQAAIALGQQLREDRTMITSERTLNELAIVGFSDIKHFKVEHGEVITRPGVPEYATRAISSAEFTTTSKEDKDGNITTTEKVKIKLWSKTDALRMLAMYQKLLSPDGATINDNSRHLHVHEHNTWQVGDKKLTF